MPACRRPPAAERGLEYRLPCDPPAWRRDVDWTCAANPERPRRNRSLRDILHRRRGPYSGSRLLVPGFLRRGSSSPPGVVFPPRRRMILSKALNPARPRRSAKYFAVWRAETFSATAVATNWLMRSEEHTSELQSPCNIVCRLLLEK